MTRRNFRNGYTGNVNVYRVNFNIHSEIEGLTWFCVFKQNDVAYVRLIEDNACVFPAEVLQNDGVVEIGCYAEPFGDENYKRISTNWVNVNILKGAYSEATAPEVPQPDVWETLVSRSIPVIGENGNWFVYDLTVKDYVDSGVSAKGIDGKDGQDGLPGANGSDGVDGYTPQKGIDYWTSEDKAEIETYIDEQTEIIKADVEGLQQQINEEAHFRGYLSTNAKIQVLVATPNDFAYSAESGTKWIYDAEDGWKDSGTPVPDQLTPASIATPLMDGIPTAGESEEYARGDHRHPTDTTRVSVEAFNELKADLETGLDNIIAIQNSLIGGDA